MLPEFAVILGPKLAELFEWRAYDGITLGPHELWEEGRDPSVAIAGDTIGGTSCFELLMDGKREKAPSSALNVIKQVVGDAMVCNLEDTPSLACMADKGEGIRVSKIDNWHGII